MATVIWWGIIVAILHWWKLNDNKEVLIAPTQLLNALIELISQNWVWALQISAPDVGNFNFNRSHKFTAWINQSMCLYAVETWQKHIFFKSRYEPPASQQSQLAITNSAWRGYWDHTLPIFQIIIGNVLIQQAYKCHEGMKGHTVCLCQNILIF